MNQESITLPVRAPYFLLAVFVFYSYSSLVDAPASEKVYVFALLAFLSALFIKNMRGSRFIRIHPESITLPQLGKTLQISVTDIRSWDEVTNPPSLERLSIKTMDEKEHLIWSFSLTAYDYEHVRSYLESIKPRQPGPHPFPFSALVLLLLSSSLLIYNLIARSNYHIAFICLLMSLFLLSLGMIKSDPSPSSESWRRRQVYFLAPLIFTAFLYFFESRVFSSSLPLGSFFTLTVVTIFFFSWGYQKLFRRWEMLALISFFTLALLPWGNEIFNYLTSSF